MVYNVVTSGKLFSVNSILTHGQPSLPEPNTYKNIILKLHYKLWI